MTATSGTPDDDAPRMADVDALPADVRARLRVTLDGVHVPSVTRYSIALGVVEATAPTLGELRGMVRNADIRTGRIDTKRLPDGTWHATLRGRVDATLTPRSEPTP